MAARSAQAAERFNWFRLLQAPTPHHMANSLRENNLSDMNLSGTPNNLSNKTYSTMVIGLELDVAVQLDEVSVSLDYELLRPCGSVGVSALRLRMGQVGLYGKACRRSLTAQLRLGALALDGVSASVCSCVRGVGRVGGWVDVYSTHACIEYVDVCVCGCVCVVCSICIFTQLRVQIYVPCEHVCKRARERACKHTNIYTHTHTHTRTLGL